MKLRFIIDGQMPGLNEMIEEARKHAHAGARQKRIWTDACGWAAKRARLPKLAGPVSISISWIEPDRRRDMDNISAGIKYVLDGLVKVGVLAGDGRKHVIGISHDFPDPDAARPRVEVELEQLQTAGPVR